jgi:sucrose-6-phosphate hydrolase SacC (GH32 family)
VSFIVSTGSSKALYLIVRGQTLAFDWATASLTLVNGRPHKLGLAEQSVRLPMTTGSAAQLSCRLVVDLTSIEVFINDGRVSASFCYLPDAHTDPLIFYGSGDDQRLEHFALFELKSIFEQ